MRALARRDDSALASSRSDAHPGAFDRRLRRHDPPLLGDRFLLLGSPLLSASHASRVPRLGRARVRAPRFRRARARRRVVRSALPSRPPSGGATTLPAQLADALAPASTAGRLADDVLLRIPMRMQGGTYVVEYVIGETSVRGVLDTGSPFITMEARCGEYWGCLREADARPSGYEETYEIYGLQEDGVTKWVLGDVQFRGEGRVQARSRRRRVRRRRHLDVFLVPHSLDGNGRAHRRERRFEFRFVSTSATVRLSRGVARRDERA